MFFQEMGLSEISLEDLEALAASWMNQRRRLVSPKTLGRRITSMRALGKCLGVSILAEYTAPTPARAVPHPLPGLANDLRKMIEAARNDEQRALIALTGMCGLRITEAREVDPVADFDLQEMTLSVRGKGDRTRVVPISKEAWSIMCPRVIEARINGEPTVITFTDRYARDIISSLGVRAKVKRPVSSHDMRATFATLAYNHSGGDIRAVQELLGHASVVQTQLYTGVTMEGMRLAASFDINLEDE
jgi:integrase/recombinase XerC